MFDANHLATFVVALAFALAFVFGAVAQRVSFCARASASRAQREPRPRS